MTRDRGQSLLWRKTAVYVAGLMPGLLPLSAAVGSDTVFEPSERAETWISGRIVDSENRPVPGVQVYATPHVVGENLSQALRLSTRRLTDEQGHFNLIVPFAGIRYHVLVEKP